MCDNLQIHRKPAILGQGLMPLLHIQGLNLICISLGYFVFIQNSEEYYSVPSGLMVVQSSLASRVQLNLPLSAER